MSTFETKDVEIGGEVYRLTKFGATQAIKVSLRVAKYVGHMAEAAANSPNDQATILRVLGTFSEEDFFAVKDAFADRTVVITGEKTLLLSKVFDTHFAGRGGELLEWFAACIEFQLLDFFAGALAGRNAKAGPEKAAVASSPPESTG